MGLSALPPRPQGAALAGPALPRPPHGVQARSGAGGAHPPQWSGVVSAVEIKPHKAETLDRGPLGGPSSTGRRQEVRG